MEWIEKTYDQLTKDDLYLILKERVDIFVVEQECPYPEIDGYDKESLHLYLQEGDKIIAYARLLPKHTKYEEASIGRVIVKQECRGKGYARELMNRSIEIMVNKWKESKIKLQGQEYLRHFYGSFGFEEISDVYLDDGIPHVDMMLYSNTEE